MSITIYNKNGENYNATLLTHAELVKVLKTCELIEIVEPKLQNDNDKYIYLRTVQKIVHLVYKLNHKVEINTLGVSGKKEVLQLPLVHQIVNNLNDANMNHANVNHANVNEVTVAQPVNYTVIIYNNLLLAAKLGLKVSLN